MRAFPKQTNFEVILVPCEKGQRTPVINALKQKGYSTIPGWSMDYYETVDYIGFYLPMKSDDYGHGVIHMYGNNYKTNRVVLRTQDLSQVPDLNASFS